MITVIPAIDLIDGRCVRLSRGDFDRVKVYETSPLDLAVTYRDAGFRFLHLVDLDGAREGQPVQLSVLEGIASASDAMIQVGGGIKTDDDVRAVLGSGAARVVTGSAAVRDPAMVHRWIDTFGPDRVVIAADSLEGRVRVDAWREESDMDVLDLLRDYHTAGARWALCTDVARDGEMAGPALGLYQRIQKSAPELSLIASGGVRSVADVAALDAQGTAAVVIGKALLDGSIALEELEAYAC